MRISFSYSLVGFEDLRFSKVRSLVFGGHSVWMFTEVNFFRDQSDSVLG